MGEFGEVARRNGRDGSDGRDELRLDGWIVVDDGPTRIRLAWQSTVDRNVIVIVAAWRDGIDEMQSPAALDGVAAIAGPYPAEQ